MARQLQADRSRFFFDAAGKSFSVVKFSAVEGISSLFKADLTLAFEDEVSSQEVLGKAGILSLDGADGDRFFHGIVSQFEAAGNKGRYFLYRVKLVPTVWLAGQRRDCRIFQNLNTPDIISLILKDMGLTTDMFVFRLQATYAPREYCVQYRETDLDFISRLLEEEGIFYFFEFTDDNHVLVFGDSTVNYQPIAGNAQVVFNAGGEMVSEEESIDQFRRRQQIMPGKYVHTDFNFQKPDLNLKAESVASEYDKLEIYDHPGDYMAENEGKNLARIRLEQYRMHMDTIQGRSDCIRLLPGFTFNLSGHDTDAFNAEYLVARVVHNGRQPQVLEEMSAGSEGSSYANTFSGIPGSVTIRPERRTSKPVIEGPQTAVVTGPQGEEIYPDKYGRVKVKFHWDRLSEKNEKSSCWIRVSQPWAGSGWGAMFIPRVGQEVIVNFLEGDPDRPIITGRVYHGTNLPPYELPAEKTKSTLKSKSSKDGQGCNEIRFEDKKGEEELFLQAEKDMNIHVKNDQKNAVGRDCHLVIERDLLEKVERDYHLKVVGNLHREIDKDEHLKITGKSAREVIGSVSLKVGGDVIESFQASHVENTANGYKLKAIDALIEASSNVTLKCGGSSLVLTPGGIYIEGAIVNVNSGAGPAASVSTGALVAPGLPLAAVATGSVTAGMAPADAAAHDAPTHRAPQEADEKPEEEKGWIEIELLDEDDRPIAGERYRVILADGSTVAQGTTDDKGCARVGGIDPGTCKVTFPDRDKAAWSKR
jgi:type VI secretion system secreted protein VgrG